MSQAIAERLTSGIWAVRCFRCGKDIGTMTGPILSMALVATAHKGGVLCPICRAKACTECGLELDEGQRRGSLCYFCKEEKEMTEERAEHNICEIPF